MMSINISKPGKTIFLIVFLTFAVVLTTLNLVWKEGSGTPRVKIRTRPERVRTRPKSRDLSTQARDVGEVPQDIRESVDPHLIDFVVAGFPKCGTTYLQNKILYPSERIFIPHRETHFLQNDKYSEFVAEFENVTKSRSKANCSEIEGSRRKEKVIGYKAPFELGHERSLRNLETLFPEVHMIVTLRHPVLQFESLYNYKLRTLPYLIPRVEDFVGVCGELCRKHSDNNKMEVSSTGTEQINTNFDNEDDFRAYLSSTKEMSRVTEFNAKKATKKVTGKEQHCLSEQLTFCTGESNYHQYLSRLGLTSMDTPEELALLDHHEMPIHDFSSKGSSADDSNDKAKLFLIEIGQFDNRKNQTMADDVVTDLENFLGLDTGDLPRIPHRNGDKRPKKAYDYPEERKGQLLDICLDQYEPLRAILLETSNKASKWITEYLLQPSNRRRVDVSNIDMFLSMVGEWKIDPCLNRDDRF